MSLFDELKEQFDIYDWKDQRPEQHYFKVKKDQARSLIHHLQTVRGYGHLSFMTAVDHMEEGRFHLIYMVHHFGEKQDLGVTVEIERENPSMESIHDLWPAAATYQRELREMYGIDYPGSPGVNDSFVLEGWHDIPPMRRDFDTLEFSEKTYYPRPGRETRDTAKHMKEKLYPSEAETW